MSTTVTNGAHGPLVVDVSPDVLVQNAFEYPPEVVIRYKRSLNTEDAADVVIVASLQAYSDFHVISLVILTHLFHACVNNQPGPMTVSWGYSYSDDLNAPLAAGGVTTVTFIPAII